MSKILITGATGFVGAAVCRFLREKGHMLSGTTRDGDRRAGPGNVPLYHIPVIGPDTEWSQPVSGADAVIHLAARVHVMKDREADPLAASRHINTEGTRQLAAAAAAAGVKRFIFVSTTKVMGELSGDRPFSENDEAQPEDAYGISKWEAEQVLRNIGRSTAMETVIVRPPLVYGPGVKGNFLSLVKACENGWPLPLGRVENSRSLIYVDNLAGAINICLDHSGAAGQTYFVSDGNDVSTPELIRRIAKALGRQANIINLPLSGLKAAGLLIGKSAAIGRLTGSLTVDSAKIRSETSWTPACSMTEGLKRTAEWYLDK